MTSEQILQQMKNSFRSEAADLIADLDNALLELEARPSDRDVINRIFRAVHTVKGSGATAGFTRLATFAHGVEEVFNAAREDRLAITPELVDCALRACDLLGILLNEDSPGAYRSEEEAILAALSRFLPTDSTQSGRSETLPPSSVPLRNGDVTYSIRFEPHPDIFFSGTDPASLVQELSDLGKLSVAPDFSRFPRVEDFNPEQCYLSWDLSLSTAQPESVIRDVFLYVEDDCVVAIKAQDRSGDLSGLPPGMLDAFLQDTLDLLQSAEAEALSVESSGKTGDSVGSLFRSFHNIKSNARLLLSDAACAGLNSAHPLRWCEKLAHALETLLEDARNAGTCGDELIETVLRTRDALGTMITAIEARKASVAIDEELAGRLGLAGFGAPETGTPPSVDPTDSRRSAFFNTADQCGQLIDSCLSRLQSGTLDSPGVEAYLRALRTLETASRYQGYAVVAASITNQVLVLDSAVKSGEAIDPRVADQLTGLHTDLKTVLGRLRKDGSETGEAQAAAKTTTASSAPETARQQGIRVDQEKLDRLMRLAGELLVARGAFPILADKLGQERGLNDISREVKEAGQNVSRLADDLQATVMAIRMLPVKAVFQKFPRMVRDIARSLGKDVKFVTTGEEVELDKTVLEQIGDPLVHLVRNAVDHGIETPDERIAKGKPASGTLRLEAVNQGSNVLIRIGDDGKGISAASLKRKALEKGIITAEEAAAMSEDAAFQLVFAPGLSTAAKVTDVSGRGVGMDVVRNNIQRLQGSVSIESKADAGTTFSIKLPTSLMISKGILVRSAAQEFILPIEGILDMVKIPAESVRAYRERRIAQVRGHVYPLAALSDQLGLGEEAEQEELSVALLQTASGRFGLIVEKFVSEVEVVLKPLTGGLKQMGEYLGAAILGDGRIVLVLNVDQVVR